MYGLLREEGFSERCTLLVDLRGIVRYCRLNALNQARSILDYIDAIEAIAE